MNNAKDSLGDRMKGYENISRIYLTKRMPIIIRIDGKAFHSYTKGLKRPFDDILIKAMQDTAKYLCANIMGCKLAYTQSDEISLLLIDYEKNETQPWFENNLQKMASVAASMATMAFNHFWGDDSAIDDEDYAKLIRSKWGLAMFDARVFVLPKEEVCNYFIWRQQDAARNSIQMVAQSLFSHKELQKKSCNVLQEMMFQLKGINWNDYQTVYKRGSCITRETYPVLDYVDDVGNTSVAMRSRWTVDKEIPIFTQDRDYIERWV